MDSELKDKRYHLGNLSPAPGSRTKPKRVGTGNRLRAWEDRHQGDERVRNSRSGGGVRPGLKGAKCPSKEGSPRRGFTPISRISYTLVNIRDLKSFASGSTVDVPALIQKGVIRHLKDAVKLLGHGEIQIPLFVKVNKCSQGARQKIEAAGGTVEVI